MARTIFHSLGGGGREACGREEIELVGGKEKRAGALEPKQLVCGRNFSMII